MSEVNLVPTIDWWQVVIGIVVAILAIKVVWTGFDFLIEKFGITTKKSIENKDSQQLLSDTASAVQTLTASIEEIESQRQLDFNESQKQDEKVMEVLNSLELKVDQLDQKTIANAEGTIELLRETIDQKCDYYINTLHGIRKSDVEILVGLRDTYDNFNKLGIVANHKRQAIIEKCLRLPIISDDSDLEKIINE